MLLGPIIRNRRQHAKMTLESLAKAIDSDAGNLSRIERGELGISEAQIRKIASALNTSPAQLFAESDADIAPSAEAIALDNTNAQDFVHWFRSAAPYIHAFSGKTFVIAFGGEIISEQQLISLSHDLNLLASLDVRIVLVHGVRPQVEQRLVREGLKPVYHNGLRITDQWPALIFGSPAAIS